MLINHELDETYIILYIYEFNSQINAEKSTNYKISKCQTVNVKILCKYRTICATKRKKQGKYTSVINEY